MPKLRILGLFLLINPLTPPFRSVFLIVPVTFSVLVSSSIFVLRRGPQNIIYSNSSKFYGILSYPPQTLAIAFYISMGNIYLYATGPTINGCTPLTTGT